MSERECVMAHLWERVLTAFAKGNTDEAEKLVQFHDCLDAMGDSEYGAIYTTEAVLA